MSRFIRCALGKLPLLSGLLLIGLPSAWSQTSKVQVSVRPAQVRNGENVTFKILVTTEERGTIQPPRVSQLENFDVISSTMTQSPMITSINGVTKYVNRSEFIYFLRPLKTGKLIIPSFEVTVGNRTIQTDSVDVEVFKIGSLAQRPRSQHLDPTPRRPGIPSMPQFPDEDLEAQDQGNGLGQNPNAPPKPDFDIPKNESFFVRGTTDKKEYYEGELVDLSYYLFQRTRNLNTPEMAKFPEFKGFVKEELFIARSFEMERVQLGNELLLRSRLARYALFPVKTGKLTIDSLRFRAQVYRSMEDLVNSLLQGAPAPNFGPPIPMEKSSGPIEILVKPLPATPAGMTFTGAVGQFQMEVVPPPTSVTTQQPFSIVVKIQGRGNLKLFEEMPLKLPKGLELYQVKGGTGELDESGYGNRSFEYLILPREPGDYTIEVPNWSYFNPQASKYESIPGREIRVNAIGQSFAEQDPSTGKATETVDVGPMRTGSQSFFKADGPVTDSRWAGNQWIWFLGAGSYFALALAFFQIRRKENEADYYKQKPWEATARKISQKEYKNFVGLAVLIDNYVRQRISGIFSSHGLHGESTPDDFMKVLSENTKTGAKESLTELKRLWVELDLLRFGGKSGNPPTESALEQLFPRARKLCDKVLSQVEIKESDDDEE